MGTFKLPFVALVTWLVVGAVAAAAPPAGEAKDAKQSWIRLSRDDNGRPTALETAIVHCVPINGNRRMPTVDLVAAIHIADMAYYKRLNGDFKGYDAVLYELVATEATSVPRPGRSTENNPISFLQNAVKDVLDLSFQLDGIDYAAKNMVHADMSPEDFRKSMKKRGETALGMVARLLGYALTRESQSNDAVDSLKLLAALMDENRALALKRIVAEQLLESDDALAALEGPRGSTLISGRNEVALEVLRKQLAAGKRKIAIFYGGGHMPDFVRRLRDDFGLRPVETRWLTAWNLK